MKKRRYRRSSLFGRAWMALSISLTAWTPAIYFYRRMSISQIVSFVQVKVVQIGSVAGERAAWKNWANPRRGKSGNGSSRGNLDRDDGPRVWQKTRGRRRKGFNKFLWSPLSGVNHTVIGHLRDVHLPRCSFVGGDVLFRIIYGSFWLSSRILVKKFRNGPVPRDVHITVCKNY